MDKLENIIQGKLGMACGNTLLSFKNTASKALALFQSGC